MYKAAQFIPIYSTIYGFYSHVYNVITSFVIFCFLVNIQLVKR